MSEVDKLKSEIDALKKRLIMVEQHQQVAAAASEPAGTTTVGSLTNISDAQLANNPLLYVEHPDGGLNVYLSQIVTEAQKDIPAENVTTGTLGLKRIPVAPNNSEAGNGFGGFRYTISGSTLNLYTS
ncbi:Whole genome shotgun sequence [Vibrio owensii]|uniref:Whole genome shotgun sequence n=1 Tax=Vibrio owensii TaxID=696485 RepID=A0AAU9PYT8_9VIBR|nr:Whole genome shotgun sequence [Vibrio owensii]